MEPGFAIGGVIVQVAGMWQRAGAWLLDRIYPPSCIGCDLVLRNGRSLCGDCESLLPRLKAPFCKSCGEMFEGRIDGAVACPNCEDLKYAFEFARPALPRNERTLEMVHRLKYGRELHLATELGRLAQEGLSDERFAPALAGRWPLVPVPLHRKRQRQRHFNQSSEIARALGRQVGLPVLDALKRTRATDTQTRLNRHQRLKNLRGAFQLSWRGTRELKQGAPGIILIDDVLTTGSTADACARVLLKVGVSRVMVLTVMRG